MTDPAEPATERGTSQVPAHVKEQIGLLATMRARSEGRVGRHQRAIEAITAGLGQPRSIYVLVALVVAWSALNGGMARMGVGPLDPPPFFWLQGFVALYAAVTSTMVLTTQNRQNKHAEHRAYLELQVNLLAEQKTAKIIDLLEELRRDMPAVKDRVDKEAEVLSNAVNPIAVLSALQSTLEAPAEPRRDDDAR